MTLPHWLDTPFVHALGWTLIHSLWQATIIALVLRLLSGAIARRGTRFRYGLALGGMLLIVVAAGAKAGRKSEHWEEGLTFLPCLYHP